MSNFPLPTWRSLAAAGISAVLVAGIGLVSSSAAEPPAASGDAAHERMGRPWAQHLQSHLDRLAERLEIKASQQDAWQKFTAAVTETMEDHGPDGHGAKGHEPGADLDAAALARRHAEQAQRHAQHLLQLADATAALEASLGANQRKVLDEVARHLASEHEGRGPAWGRWHGDGDGEHEGDHCEGRGPGHYHGGEGMHGAMPDGWTHPGEAAPTPGAPH